MMCPRPLLAAAALVALLLVLGASPVSAAGTQAVYAMTGADTFRIGTFHRSIKLGAEERIGIVVRHGTATLTTTKDDDPDFISIVNQPLPAALRSDELRAIAALHQRVALDIPSRIGETKLSGYLEPASPQSSRGFIGVRFSAHAHVTIPLPDNPGTIVQGLLTLDGTAYYSRTTGVLDRIESRLSLDGRLRGGDSAAPVRISYERNIHSVPQTVALHRGLH